MPLSPVGLCNRALLKIGAQPIQSFYDERVEADIALNFYEPLRDALLCAYPWRFATRQISLPQLETPPLSDYSYAFQLPGDCLRILSLGGASYRRIGNTLQANTQTAIIDYIFRPGEDIFPAYFEQALIARLAAEFCLPLTENSSRASLLYELSENEFTRAKQIDAQQDTPRALDDYSLINARES